jgi:hypothetical protein
MFSVFLLAMRRAVEGLATKPEHLGAGPKTNPLVK